MTVLLKFSVGNLHRFALRNNRLDLPFSDTPQILTVFILHYTVVLHFLVAPLMLIQIVLIITLGRCKGNL